MENKVLCTRITLYTTNKKHEREREKGKLCIEKIFPISKALHVPIFCIFLYRYYYYSVFVFYFSFFSFSRTKNIQNTESTTGHECTKKCYTKAFIVIIMFIILAQLQIFVCVFVFVCVCMNNRKKKRRDDEKIIIMKKGRECESDCTL